MFLYISLFLQDVEELKSLFYRGQILPLKILEKIQKQNGSDQILASISPEHVNSKFVHHNFKKGMLMWAAVTSEGDHGYHLDNGVSNIRIFLPHANVDNQNLGKYVHILFTAIWLKKVYLWVGIKTVKAWYRKCKIMVVEYRWKSFQY